MVFGEHIADIEVLPAGAAALHHDQELFRVLNLCVHRVRRPGDAHRACVESRIEDVLEPPLADRKRRDRRKLAQVLVESGVTQFLLRLVAQAPAAVIGRAGETSRGERQQD